jgi:NMD protein affecting ribosome stability and mRNA decay
MPPRRRASRQLTRMRPDLCPTCDQIIPGNRVAEIKERMRAREQAQELLDMRVKEQKTHDKMWKDQDILYRSIQKTGAELSNRVDIILGIAAKVATAVNGQ